MYLLSIGKKEGLKIGRQIHYQKRKSSMLSYLTISRNPASVRHEKHKLGKIFFTSSNQLIGSSYQSFDPIFRISWFRLSATYDLDRMVAFSLISSFLHQDVQYSVQYRPRRAGCFNEEKGKYIYPTISPLGAYNLPTTSIFKFGKKTNI